jgi:hypothetical protein
MTAGYCHRRYAESFTEFGRPRELPNCGGWLVERAIPGSALFDGMGCYPLFDCERWSRLPLDLSALADSLVSVALVANPFGDATEADLRTWFDVVIPYKQHHVTDLERPVADLLGRHHRRSVQKAFRRVEVSTCPTPCALLDEWCALYGQLSARHGITGLRAFSRVAFERQFDVPGMVAFRASVGGEIVGLHCWYVRGHIAYGHLGATSARGYEYMASYALYWYAIEYFGECVRWLDLGGVAGLSDGESAEGLRRFKSGWATGTRPTFLCGRVLQPSAYARLTTERAVGKTTYFPAYRCGEFSSSLGRIDISTWR